MKCKSAANLCIAFNCWRQAEVMDQWISPGSGESKKSEDFNEERLLVYITLCSDSGHYHALVPIAYRGNKLSSSALQDHMVSGLQLESFFCHYVGGDGSHTQTVLPQQPSSRFTRRKRKISLKTTTSTRECVHKIRLGSACLGFLDIRDDTLISRLQRLVLASLFTRLL
jgi:hypothetical protein